MDGPASSGGVILKGERWADQAEGLWRAARGGEGPEVELEGDEGGLPLRRGEVELMRFSVAPTGEAGGLNDSDRG